MQFKFYSTGRKFSLLFALALPTMLFAQLDWDNDVVVFGTEQHEWNPQLVSIGPGQFRAFCVRESNVLSMRTTQMHGEVWEAYADVTESSGFIQLSAANDNINTYLASYPQTTDNMHIWSIAHSATNWPTAATPIQLPESITPVDVQLLSDYSYAPDDPYVHVFVLLGTLDNIGYVGHAYATNYGANWSTLLWDSGTEFPFQDSSASIAGAVTWEDDVEHIWAAVAVDRAGTTGEQIMLYKSDNFGESLTPLLTPDSSAYAQSNPALVGFESTLMLVYQRRVSPSLARDIFAIYSPDNGVSWSEPLQLTNHPFDDVAPKLAFANGEFGLVYSRAAVQQEHGQLFFRSTSLTQPWAWNEEIAICDEGALILNEGFALSDDADGFAAVWGGRLVGDDGDIFFDGSWRGTAIGAPRRDEQNSINVFPNPSTGWLELSSDNRQARTITLFDILGREVARTELTQGVIIWQLPSALPSGSYWLRAGLTEHAVRIQILK